MPLDLGLISAWCGLRLLVGLNVGGGVAGVRLPRSGFYGLHDIFPSLSSICRLMTWHAPLLLPRIALVNVWAGVFSVD